MPNRCAGCLPAGLCPTCKCRCTRVSSGLARLAAGLVLAAVLQNLNAPPAAAQAGTTTGIIRGTVSDQLGAPLAGAVVVIQHRETDLVTTVETSAAGTFVRALLPPGTYDLTVAAATAGLGTERIEGAGLRVGETVALDVQLRVVAAETVNVVSSLPSP
ncbi:MAG: carboxypeptidase regulatory-like domain-containing protein, partial [Acidobacteria bacterium]|nr:carboxypeptidase regulatory-like domain-containing protein [Acidobacteriota bacterium]